MRLSIQMGIVTVIFCSSAAFAQQDSLIPSAHVVTAAQAVDLAKLDGQLIQLSDAKVVHADSAQLFMFGEPTGRQAHVLIPAPAIAAAKVGDVVEVRGRVRRYSPSDFERDYKWYKTSDYPDIKAGDWVIVASSVRTPEGSQMVPGSTVSDLAPDTPRTRPSSSK